ncbi:MAG: pyruvate kinase, partial [Bacilli bacterium]
MKKTKIICTIGPSTDSKEMLRQMMEQGMDVARINMTHASHDQARNIIYTIREVNKELSRNVGILIDTKGPELCLKTGDEGAIRLEVGNHVILTAKKGPESEGKFIVNYP